jgi:hypothetical protein
MKNLSFDSIEQERAWALTVEQIYNYTRRMSLEKKTLDRVQAEAAEGLPIAMYVIAHYTALRLKG